jgi:hypothetical protein
MPLGHSRGNWFSSRIRTGSADEDDENDEAAEEEEEVASRGWSRSERQSDWGV